MIFCDSSFLASLFVETAKLHKPASRIAQKFTEQLFCRSLDLLQVASALILSADTFVTFDKKQGKLAMAAGLKVLPGHGD